MPSKLQKGGPIGLVLNIYNNPFAWSVVKSIAMFAVGIKIARECVGMDVTAGSTYSHVLALRQPNIVLLVTDDQDGQGVFVTTPLCCPSRSSMLTGLYLHNTKVVNNSLSGGCSSRQWQLKHEPKTFATALHNKGYISFYAGKYLNQYGKKMVGGLRHVPPGWDWWVGLQGNSRYYNYTLSINGSAKYFQKDYLTDVIAGYATDFLHMHKHSTKPFLMVVAPPAPHSPFTPADRHKNFFRNASVPRTPNFNPGAQTDKHWLVRMPPSHLSDFLVTKIDEYWRLRWCSLLAVDELVEKLIHTLKYHGQLDNTYFIVTSDNGYHLGHYGLAWDKRQPYDTDIRVPLIVRGPKVARRHTIDAPVLLLDIAPTILEMAALSPPSYMDGTSFLSLIKKPVKTRRSKRFTRTFLLEYRGEGNQKSIDSKCPWNKDDTLSNCEMDSLCKCQDARNNTYDCVRSLDVNNDFQICFFSDNEKFVEAYNLTRDPFQMENVASKVKEETIRQHRSILRQLKKCRGVTCRVKLTFPRGVEIS